MVTTTSAGSQLLKSTYNDGTFHCKSCFAQTSPDYIIILISVTTASEAKWTISSLLQAANQLVHFVCISITLFKTEYNYKWVDLHRSNTINRVSIGWLTSLTYDPEMRQEDCFPTYDYARSR